MDRTNLNIIEPLKNKPRTIDKKILYPQYVAEVNIAIPRAIGRPRRFKIFLLTDACTGKVYRCDSWPSLKNDDSNYETVSQKVNLKDVKTNILEFATKKFARRYQSYWKPQVDIVRLNLVYKVFWMIDSKSAIDSLTAKKLNFS